MGEINNQALFNSAILISLHNTFEFRGVMIQQIYENVGSEIISDEHQFGRIIFFYS